MKSVYNFVVAPLKSRYNNTKRVGEKELIVNTKIFSHQYVSREAIVKHVPTIGETDIKVGDTVIVHHNVFRKWHNQYGVEKNSRGYIDENNYLVQPDQVFLHKKNGWKAQKGYCFIAPIKSTNKLSTDKEKPLVGVVKYTDGSFKKGDLVGFTPNSEYEFIIEGQKLYRVLSKFITIKYEYQGDEEEYNPSWA
tara:strand:- start:642 stop:1220 length:579 start_codon:yes stop_codon:yes gene_type:complete